MIPLEVENRIARYYFQKYLPEKIMMELEEKLLPFYLESTEPPEDEVVKLTLTILNTNLEK